MKEKMLIWSPRILAILAILFLMLFSFDCFEAGQGFRRQMTCFFMLFVAAAITGSIIFNGFDGNYGVNIIMAPFVIAGVLFMIHHYLYPRNDRTLDA